MILIHICTYTFVPNLWKQLLHMLRTVSQIWWLLPDKYHPPTNKCYKILSTIKNTSKVYTIIYTITIYRMVFLGDLDNVQNENECLLFYRSSNKSHII